MSDQNNPITDTTDFSDIDGVVYVRLNATNWRNDGTGYLLYSIILQNSPPDSVADIYEKATILSSSTQTRSDDLTIDLAGLSGNFSAIAIYLDPVTDGTNNYIFSGFSDGGFDPVSAINDGEDLTKNPISLTFIDGDTYDDSGRTVVIVCPIAAGNSVPFTLDVTETSPLGSVTPLHIDPHIKNGGYGVQILSTAPKKTE